VTDNEKKVREAWKFADIRHTSLTSAGPWYVVFGGDGFDKAFHGRWPETVWHAAAAFTDERRERIRQVEEELDRIIFAVKAAPVLVNTDEQLIWHRILTREQAALDDLRKGMKL
jgi:hypothetical protein